MSGDQVTIDFYQREAPAYTASGSQGQSRHLQGFLDLLAPGSRVLELGCGGGRDAAYMVERGFQVDPTDGTPAMVRKAQERWDLPARVMRFSELDACEEYDAIWAHASLLHCPRGELPDVLRRIHTALKPGGWHYANFKEGAGEGRDKFDRYYNFPTLNWLEHTYSEAIDWEEVFIEENEGSGYDGVPRAWIAVTARKAN